MIKQVIVVRKDLNMRKGKIAAQCCHASMKILLDRMIETRFSFLNYENPFILIQTTPHLDEWIKGLFTKIVVYVNSEEELLDVYNQAKNKNILCSLIEDAGNTEFHGIPTKTCCAIGPDESEIIDEVTGKLSLL